MASLVPVMLLSVALSAVALAAGVATIFVSGVDLLLCL
jgi:hypothetical protein